MLVGGWNRDKQTFNRTAANAQSAMLLLALAALILPAAFQLIHGGSLPGGRRGAARVLSSDVEDLSLGVAIILMLSYVVRAVLLDEDPPRRLQPVRGGATPSTEERLVDPQVARAARDRGGAGRPDVGDPRRLDLRGVGRHRAVRVLRRRVRGGDRRQRRRALGRGAGRGEGQDGPRRQHRDRLERADRALRRARARAALVRRRARSRCRSSSTATSSARCCSPS